MAYASVVLDIPTRALTEPYDYRVPDRLSGQVDVGATVLVTFSGRSAVGYVVSTAEEPPAGVDPAKVRDVEEVLAAPAFDRVAADLALWMAREYAAPPASCLRLLLPPGQTVKVVRDDGSGPWRLVNEQVKAADDRWVRLGEKACGYEPRRNAVRQRELLEALAEGPQRLAELKAVVPGAQGVVTALAKKGVVVVESRRTQGPATTLSSARATRPERLSDGQVRALEAVDSAVAEGSGGVVLVDGVTGSGKTEVYLSAIERVLGQGRGAVVLVPEISLTAQTVGRFRSRFGDTVSILHSRLSTGERREQWERIRSGEARVVVGARSALFAPMGDLGLVVVDEEHEHSYKQDQAPRYHARDVAAELARLRGGALVLGSATPSMEAVARCARGSWRGAPWVPVTMEERPGGATLPVVQVVDMRSQFAANNNSPFSAPLRTALVENFEAGHKSVLLLNRRGFATFLMCRDCGCVPTCPHCSTALTYHERTHELACHSCGRTWPQAAFPNPSTHCPACGSRYLAAYGVGTQRVEDELRMMLPDAPVVRMDADTTRGKGAHQALLEEFDAADGAVLIGTQMIAKGLDFPEVTLVGVINADTTLKLPDFRASERTYDLLEQVAGRAGRGEDPGRVLVQTYWPTHPAVTCVAGHDRAAFRAFELADREEAAYPPFRRLGNVVVSGVNGALVERVVAQIAAALRSRAEGRPGWQVVGPAECVKGKVADRLRRHVLVKAPVDGDLGGFLASACSAVDSRGVSVAIDVDAYDLL